MDQVAAAFVARLGAPQPRRGGPVQPACRTFSERQLQMAQKTEDRGDADLDLSPGEPVPQFTQSSHSNHHRKTN